MQNKIPKYSVYVFYIHLPIYIHKLKLQERIKSGIHFQTSVHIKTRTREQVTYRTSVAQLQFVRSAEDPSCWAGFMEAVVGIVPRGRIKFVRGRYKGQKVVNLMRLARAPGPEDQWRGRCY